MNDAPEKELTELRAFKAACEGQEAVAWMNNTRDMTFRYSVSDIPLYEHPDPQAAELRMLLDEQKQTIAALNMCIGGEGSTTTENLVRVSRLEAYIAELEAQLEARDQQVAEACAKLAENRKPRFSEFSTPSKDIAQEIRSGEWRKHLDDKP